MEITSAVSATGLAGLQTPLQLEVFAAVERPIFMADVPINTQSLKIAAPERTLSVS